MERTHSWHVVCIKTTEPEFDDCRQITEIGYLAPTLRLKPVDVASSMIRSGLSKFHMEHDGGKRPLLSAKHDRMYVRTLEEDAPEDPLLALPDVEEYKTQSRFANL